MHMCAYACGHTCTCMHIQIAFTLLVSITPHITPGYSHKCTHCILRMNSRLLEGMKCLKGKGNLC